MSIVSDIFVEFDDSRLISWTIEAIEDRDRRLGLAKLADFRNAFSFPLEALVSALNPFDRGAGARG